MSSLVSEFIINPVLRQARRFSEISRTTLGGGDDHQTMPADAVSDSGIAEDPEQESIVAPETPRSRPISSSTQETRVEDGLQGPEIVESPSRDHVAFALLPKKTRMIPEDDGMQELRERIQDINAREISPAEKARLMHDILLEGYRASQGTTIAAVNFKNDTSDLPGQTWEYSTSPGPLESLKFWQNQLGDGFTPEKFLLSDTDIAPTYAPIRQPKTPEGEGVAKGSSTPTDSQPPLGCQHYERNVKLQCSTCKKWYTCRFCHDSQEDHSLIRSETQNMLCMLCATPQKASDICITCGETAGEYYCDICKLWENRQSKPIYHCNDCGICRRGMGLGKDFFHCKTCRACITTSIETSHKCIERSTDCDCPICGDYMFTSPKPVVFMPCGHSIHKKCYDQHMMVSYKCPICNKSLANMETQFRNLDLAIQSQPMPSDFRKTQATILCNDCSGRTTVPYHWLGLKCSICSSYNTVELQIHGGSVGQRQADAAESQGEEMEAAPAPARLATEARPTDIPTTSHFGSYMVNRRRHSSHGVELQYRPAERVARSLSPLAMPSRDPHLPYVDYDAESEDDMLGIWRGVWSGGESSELDESESEDDDSDAAGDAEEEEEEDDLIVLIGHR